MSTAVLTPSFGSISGRPVSRGAVSRGARPVTTSHLRLTRRGRAVITVLVAAPVAIAAGVFVLNGGVAEATVESSPTSFDYVSVAPGQSLWQLAEEIAPSADPREVISDIAHLNQLESVEVQPGQRLAIPQAYSD